MGFLDKIRSFVESGELDKITEKVGQTVNTLLDEQKKRSSVCTFRCSDSDTGCSSGISCGKSRKAVTQRNFYIL